MRSTSPLQQLVRPLVEYRILLSLGLSAACGIVLNSLYPINQADPLLRLIAAGTASALSCDRVELRPLSLQHTVLWFSRWSSR